MAEGDEQKSVAPVLCGVCGCDIDTEEEFIEGEPQFRPTSVPPLELPRLLAVCCSAHALSHLPLSFAPCHAALMSLWQPQCVPPTYPGPPRSVMQCLRAPPLPH